MHIRSGMIMNKMKAEDTIKNKTSKDKQIRPLTPKQTGIAAKPRDNSEISEDVKVSNSTDLLRYISSFLLFSLLKREGFGGEMGTRLIPIFFKVDQRHYEPQRSGS